MSLHREDYESWFKTLGTWSGTHRQLVLMACIALVAFAAGAYSCSN